MHVITFYSFKGGVGRTMALVNVAAELVKLGRKVLVVDFDLEAPGLETYAHLIPPKTASGFRRRMPGIVEYVTEFRRVHQVPDLANYIYEAQPIATNGGCLWVMPAGRRDRAYRSALARLDWKRLYDEQGARGVVYLFLQTRAGWEEVYNPDYVLIDSRTGDTEVLGICTRLLPDSVVLMFVPNAQNLAGLANVCGDIRREATDGLEKKIRLHFVAANVPDLDDEKGVLRRQLQAFRKCLRFRDLSGVIRRYESLDLLDQTIHVLDRPRSRLARAYKRLVEMLIRDNLADRDGALLFLQDYAERLVPRIDGDIRSTLKRKLGAEETPADEQAGYGPLGFGRKDPLNAIAEHFLDDIEILNKIAECRILALDFDRAIRVLDRVLGLRHEIASSLFWRAMCKTKVGDVEGAADDLLAYLGLPAHKDRDAMAALRKLSDVAPERLVEAVDLLAAQGFQAVPRVSVAELLSKTEHGLPRAAQLLREFLGGLDEDSRKWWLRHEHHSPVLLPALLRARCWREVIELLEPRADMQYQLFQLALAYWGEHGEMPEALCRRALHGKVDMYRPYEEFHRDGSLWLQWRLGYTEDAMKSLDGAVQRVADATIRDFLSHWRQQWVSKEEYLEDLQKVRRMFQGESLRPEFLGPVSC